VVLIHLPVFKSNLFCELLIYKFIEHCTIVETCGNVLPLMADIFVTIFSNDLFEILNGPNKIGKTLPFFYHGYN